jgi:phosphoglycerate kinase
MTKFKSLNLNKKRIFLRADLNVPIKNSKILSDHKLQALKPTIDFIKKNGGKIILATHIGRPKQDKNYNFDETLSTSHLIPWFKKNGYEIELEANLSQAQIKSHEKHQTILLLENLRFFAGEQNQDKVFASQLSHCADFYINDAFGVIHRNDTSITLLQELYTSQNKAAGPLIEKELEKLSKLIKNPKQPFVVILGGKKITDKIPLITSLIRKREQDRPKTIIISGALAYTFLKTQGKPVGISLVDNSLLDITHSILEEAIKNNIKIILPIDHIIEGETKKPVQIIPDNTKAIDIGPQSIELFAHYINKAKTIFANGTMGIHTDQITKHGTKEIFTQICNSDAYSVIGGGDAVAAMYEHKLENKVDFISTGGGATLKCLGLTLDEIDKLPTLKSLNKDLFESAPKQP